MDLDTAEGWRDAFTHVVGLYVVHPTNFSTRMIRRRIPDVSVEDARILLGVVVILSELGSRIPPLEELADSERRQLTE